uniref:hypothetical protein n=1 Tax=uncultured Virgibacillus sp. TaxID=417355 RepID=UPI00262F5273
LKKVKKVIRPKLAYHFFQLLGFVPAPLYDIKRVGKIVYKWLSRSQFGLMEFTPQELRESTKDIMEMYVISVCKLFSVAKIISCSINTLLLCG